MKHTATESAPETIISALVATQQVDIRVKTCDVLKSVFVPEIGVSDKIVWGIQVEFTDGRSVYIRDLCTRRADAELLKWRLLGASLTADFLPDIVEDFLTELYSLPVQPNGTKGTYIHKNA